MTRKKTSDVKDDNAEEYSAPEHLDDEEMGRGDQDIKPWDPSKIRITTKNFSLRDVVDQIGDGDIDLAPDFQRDFVWKKRQQTRLIESILLGIPLPAFYFNQSDDGTYQVVDGVQRLSTIYRFMKGQHPLGGHDLEYLDALDGATYRGLDPAALRRFRSTQIVIHVIEPQTPEELKYDIFGRVNTLGSPLSAQEIRHAMSGDRSRAFLKSLIELEAFDEATEWQFWRKDADTGELVRDSGRMANRELALRFCAFRHYDEEKYRKYSNLDAYLVAFTKRIDGSSETESKLSDRAIVNLRADFKRAMENANTVMGKAAFRRWPLGQRRRGPINRALFEAQATALADYPLNALLPVKDAVVNSFREAFRDNEFARSVTVGTGDPNAVTRRLVRAKEILGILMK